MKTKDSIFYLEFKTFAGKWHLRIILLLSVLLLAMAQVGMNEDRAELKEVEIANSLENRKASQFHRYTPYSVYGIRLISRPSSLSFLSTFQVHGCLVAAVDTGTKLVIYESRKGNKVVPDTAAGYLNFPGIFLLAGSLLCLIYGFGAYKNEKQLKYLCGFKPFRNVFFSILLSRMALVSLYIAAMLLGTTIIGFINGINIVNPHFLRFSLMVLLVMNFFLFTGAAAGAAKNRKKGIAFVVMFFFLLNVLVPWLIIKTVQNISVSISEHQTEYDKLKILMAFEKRGAEKFGELRTGEEVNEFMKSYLKNEIKILEDMENEHKQRIIEKIGKYRMLSVPFPSTLFLVSSAEISGHGFDNHLAFYDFAAKKKRGFIEFYFEKEYFTKPKPVKVESFLEGKDNIFQSQSSTGENFPLGIFLVILYTITAGIVCYRNTFKKVYPVKQSLPGEADLFIHMVKGSETFLFTRDELLKAKVYNHFSGKEILKSDIAFLPEADFDTPGKIDFAYLVDTNELKDISTKTLYRFLTGKKLEKNSEKWQVMFEHALRQKVIVMDEFFRGQAPENIEEIIKELKDKNKFFLIITADYYMTRALAEKDVDIYYLKNDATAVPIIDED